LFVSLDQTPKPAPAPQSRRSPEKNITSRALPPELTNSRDELCISYRAIETLAPYAGNARVHSRAQIRKIKESIEAFGFLDPILITSGGTIIAGHGRVQAAKLLSMAEVPTICLEGLSQAQIRAYALATNRIAQDSSWDKDILKIELQHLVNLNEIDVSLTGLRCGVGSDTAEVKHSVLLMARVSERLQRRRRPVDELINDPVENAAEAPLESSDVGYCNPPRETRFKKGTSGNPKGRPKGSKNFATSFFELGREKVTVTVSLQRSASSS
jgi:ParB-like nuclease domain/Family of unknown function (DUF5681)